MLTYLNFLIYKRVSLFTLVNRDTLLYALYFNIFVFQMNYLCIYSYHPHYY